jgi:hypothetical protein
MTRVDGMFLCAAIFVAPHMTYEVAVVLSGALVAFAFLNRWLEMKEST